MDPRPSRRHRSGQTVLFIDCSIESAPGSVQLRPVEPATPQQGLATHHQGAPELLSLARDLYDSSPLNAQLMTIGAGSTELRRRLQRARPRCPAPSLRPSRANRVTLSKKLSPVAAQEFFRKNQRRPHLSAIAVSLLGENLKIASASLPVRTPPPSAANYTSSAS
jgi:hypothetical protein